MKGVSVVRIVWICAEYVEEWDRHSNMENFAAEMKERVWRVWRERGFGSELCIG